MARKIGTEYAITAELQEITIPVGDEGVGQTLINDGAAEIFWRGRDVTLSETDIEAGSAAVLVATPLFFSRLGPGEFTHQAGIVIYAIRDTTTQVDSVLRVAPGRLYQSSDVDLAQMSTAIGTTTDDVLAGETLEDDTARTGISLWKRFVNKLIDIKAQLVSTNDARNIADYYDSTTASLPFYSSGDQLGIADHFDSSVSALPLYSTNDSTGIADYFDSTALNEPLWFDSKSIGEHLSDVAKGGDADSVGPAFGEKANTTARVEGTSVGAEALVASATPYIQATVTALKPVTDIDKISIANTGTVWLCRSATNIDGATKLEPGQSAALPNNCDLADFFLAVDTSSDGVSFVYTV